MDHDERRLAVLHRSTKVMPMKRSIRFAFIGGCAGALCALLTFPATASGGWTSFQALAGSDGFRAQLVSPRAPLQDTVLDLGLPTVGAQLDGVGASRAFAAAPFPGDLALSVPGIVAGVSGQPIPPYPFIADTSYPAKTSDENDAGSIHLQASSRADFSSAEANTPVTGGVALGQLHTITSVHREIDDTLVADASSIISGLSSDALTIASITASAHVERQTDGTVTRTSSLELAGVRVAGQTIEPPTPDAKSITDALAQHGITVRYREPVKTASGITSPAVSMTAVVPIAFSGSGTSTITLTLGGAWAVITGTASPPAELTLPRPARGPTFTEVLHTHTSAGPIGQPQAVSAPQAPAPVASAPVVRLAVDRWPSNIYLLLALPGFVGAVLAFLLWRWGVRRVWDSSS